MRHRLVFLLPGNPVASLCAYDFFAEHAIRALGGRCREWPCGKTHGNLTPIDQFAHWPSRVRSRESCGQTSGAAAVVQGRADWGMTLNTVARNNRLGFLPVQDEQYDFIVPVSRAGRPGLAAFVALLQQPSTREALANPGMKP